MTMIFIINIIIMYTNLTWTKCLKFYILLKLKVNTIKDHRFLCALQFYDLYTIFFKDIRINKNLKIDDGRS